MTNPTDNTALQTFAFQNHVLRVFIDEQGAPWFIAKEVADILGYSDTHEMTKKLDDDEKSNLQIAGLGTPTGGRGTTIINESGLYASILTSKKPAAKVFRKWVTSEVLPTINKTGRYQHPAAEAAKAPDTITLSKDRYIQLLEAQITLQTTLDASKIKRRKWTAHEEAVLKANYEQGLSLPAIAKLLDRSLDSIETRLYHLNIRMGGSHV